MQRLWGRIQAILNEKPEIFDGEQVKWEVKDIEGEIEFRNLNFAYPDGTPVLKDINLKVERGTTLAIVGGTGSGKSTLCQPDSAHPSSRTRHRLCRRCRHSGYTAKRPACPISGVVEQEPFLFSDYLRNNIAYGLETPEEEQIKDAAHTADLLEQIEEFPDGLETFLGERGMTISGGQRQRSALARANYH